MNQRLFNRQFLVQKKLSQGSFGVVFEALDKINKINVALKLEKYDNCPEKALDRESYLLRRLQGTNGVPKLYWSGVDNEFNAMAIQLLGKDLSQFVKKYRKLSLKSVLMIADQMFQIIKEIHHKSVIHQDLKPENILIGKSQEESKKLYLVDFGLSKIFKDPNQKHIPFKEHKHFIGTTRYASLAAHRGQELGRKDDLESMIYVLIYLLQGHLPWQNMKEQKEDQKRLLVLKKKEESNFSELNKDIPQQIIEALKYIRGLNFSDVPDYDHLIQEFRNVANERGIIYDNQFEWIEQTTPIKNISQKELPRQIEYSHTFLMTNPDPKQLQKKQ